MFKSIGPLHCLAAILLSALLSAHAMQPPSPKSADALQNEFSAARAIEQLRALNPENMPHPVGSEANSEMLARLLAAFNALDVTASTETAISCQTSERFPSFRGCAEITNVLALITEGTDANTKPIVLMSHYDSVDAGPGAADAGHGVASVLEIARILKAEGPFKNPVWALITDGEEYGLYGANHYFGDPRRADEVGIVVNLEARGSNGPSTLFETSEDSGWLIDLFAKHAPRPLTNSLLLTAYKTLPNDTDMSESLRAGVPGVNFAFAGTVAHYHTPLDNIGILNAGSVQHQGDNALAMVRALANADLEAAPDGDFIYVSLLSRIVLRMPESFAIPLAFLAIIGIGYSVLKMPKQSSGGAVRFVVAALFVPLLLGLAVGVGFVLPILFGVFGEPAPGFAHPWTLQLSYYLSVVGIAALAAVTIGRWLGTKAVMASVWLSYGFAALGLAIFLPGASILFIVPGLVAAVVLTISAVRNGGAGVSASSLWAAAFAALIVVWPLVDMFEMLIGFQLLAVNAVTVMLAVLALVPVLTRWALDDVDAAGGLVRGRWGLPILSAVGAVVSIVATSLMPSYSEQMPMRMNVLHFTDKRTDPSVDGPVWRAASNYLPDEMRTVAEFSLERQARVPGLLRADYIAPAPHDTRPTIQVKVLQDDTVGTERTVRLGFEMPDGARGVRVLVPDDQGLQRFEYPATGISGTYQPDESARGYHFFNCLTGACREVVFTLNANSAADKKPWLAYSIMAGLPEGGEVIQAARPNWAVPSQFGDQTMRIEEIRFE